MTAIIEPYYYARELAEMSRISEDKIRAAMSCSVDSPFYLPNIASGKSKRPRRRATLSAFKAWAAKMEKMPFNA